MSDTKEKVFGVYVRVSTDEQADFGDSVEAQISLANSLIKEHGGILYDTYEEGGVSATKTELKNRTELMRCLRDIQDKKINHLIAYRRDRLARSTEDSLAIRKILKDNDCKMLFTATGEQEMNLNDPYSKLIENVRSSLDEIESAQTAIRVSDVMFEKAKKGNFTGGNLPYGYIKDGDIIKPIDSQIPIFNEVIELYLEGYGRYSIIRWLEGLNIRNKGKRHVRAQKVKQFKNSSEKWTIENIESILFNPTHTGRLQFTKRLNNENKKVIVKSSNVVPTRTLETQKLIDEEKKKRMKNIRAPRHYNTSFLLTGLITCGNCGNEYRSQTVTKKNNKRYSYYTCKGKNTNKIDRCKSKNFQKDILEQFVIQEAKMFAKQFIGEKFYKKVINNTKKADYKLKQKLDEVSKALEKSNQDFKALSRLLLDLDMDDEVYEMMKDMYQQQQKETLKKISELKQDKEKLETELSTQTTKNISMDNIIKQLENFDEVFESAPFNLKKKMLESIFSKIEIDSEGNVKFKMIFELDKSNAQVNLIPAYYNTSNRNDVMFISGVGDPITPKNITIQIDSKSYQINIFEWLSSLVNFVTDTFYKFFTTKNKKMKSPKYFSKYTGLSYSTLQSYRNSSIPNYQRMKKILGASNSSVNEYLSYVNDHFYCSKRMLETVLEYNNIIKRNVKRLDNSY